MFYVLLYYAADAEGSRSNFVATAVKMRIDVVSGALNRQICSILHPVVFISKQACLVWSGGARQLFKFDIFSAGVVK